MPYKTIQVYINNETFNVRIFKGLRYTSFFDSKFKQFFALDYVVKSKDEARLILQAYFKGIDNGKFQKASEIKRSLYL